MSPIALAEAQQSKLGRFRSVRQHSVAIASRLYPEDCVIQSMPDASPIRWHLAHTTWFFETFVLKSFDDYRPENDSFEYLFNSYYNTVGDQYPRDRRGLLSRPTVDEVHAYRRQVDQQLESRFGRLTESQLRTLEVGLHHEQQHQELMLTDVKHLLSCNPLAPAMFDDGVEDSERELTQWVHFEGGVREIGFEGDGFCFDNELPRHRVYVEPFRLSSNLVCNGEFLDFINDGGYERPEHWLSAGWSTVRQGDWKRPIYWFERNGQWQEFTLAGRRPLDLAAPLAHVSYFEADAFARWSGMRLPTEAEWEIAAEGQAVSSRGCEDTLDAMLPVHPRCTKDAESPLQDVFGAVWQWTSSQYTAYPGYRIPPGAIGEYNGKFMCNQFVLRGSSCATPRRHARTTYRNFFPPDARWQFAGIRLASDATSD
ncbi:MAG: ergothioneine biosynthesis protein EgtB [Planctomycetota bacterium]